MALAQTWMKRLDAEQHPGQADRREGTKAREDRRSRVKAMHDADSERAHAAHVREVWDTCWKDWVPEALAWVGPDAGKEALDQVLGHWHGPEFSNTLAAMRALEEARPGGCRALLEARGR